MKEEFDVIVVGAGPGGSSCASFLAKNKAKVLLLDKAVFPRDKTCGDAISGKSLGILRELGWDKEVEKLKHGKVFGVTFSAPNGTLVSIPFPKKAKKGKYKTESGKGYAVRREIFDDFVFQKTKKIVSKTIEGFNVTDLIKEDNKIVGVKGTDLKGKEMEFKAKIVVGADGANSVIAKKVGLNKIHFDHHITALRAYYKNISGLNDTIEIHFVNSLLPGYFWIFPLENGMANVGVGMVTKDIRNKKINLQQAMFDVIEKDPVFMKRFSKAKMVSPVKGWTLPLGSKKRKVFGDNFVLVGDAASLIDPFSGEGVGNAMTSGKLSSQVILKALQKNDFSEAFLKEYADNLWNELENELKTSYMLQRIGRIKFLLNFVLGKAASKKEIQEVISGMLANEEAKKDFVSPLFYLKLFFT